MSIIISETFEYCLTSLLECDIFIPHVSHENQGFPFMPPSSSTPSPFLLRQERIKNTQFIIVLFKDAISISTFADYPREDMSYFVSTKTLKQ